MKYIVLILVILFIGCVPTNNTTIYPMNKGELTHGMSMLGGGNVVLYSLRYGVNDNIEVGGQIGLLSVGFDTKIHLYRTKTNLVSLQLGMPYPGVFESGLFYSFAISPIAIRLGPKYQYVYAKYGGIYRNCINEKPVDSFHEIGEVVNSFHRLGGVISIGNKRIWGEVGYFKVLSKSVEECEKGFLNFDDGDDYSLLDKKFQILFNFGLSF